jgi:N-acetylglucosaminyldiphosphoundecaprenol N-acetyl-beta-D-mannosaminyltransferase
MREIELANLRIKGLKTDDLFVYAGKMTHVITVNAEFIVEAQNNNRLKQLINDKFSTIDGQLPYTFAKYKYHNMEFDKISGSDLIYTVAEFCQKNDNSIFLLGGNEVANEKAVETLKEKYGIRISGYSPPFMNYPFIEQENEKILLKIEGFHPDFLFVGFGMKKQEFWIDDNSIFLNSCGVKVAVGCGGIYDMVSGIRPRAPKIIIKLYMEWMYRFLIEFNFSRFKRIIKTIRVFKYL